MPECKRCGKETTATTLSGEYLCEQCQEHRQEEQETRELGQSGLSEFGT